MPQRKILFLLVGSFLIISFGLFFGTTKTGAFTTSSTGYANNGAPTLEVYRGWTNVLVMDVSLPDPIADTDIGGTAPSAGTEITDTKDTDWTTLYFYDASAGGSWDSNNDIIFVDDGNVYYDNTKDTKLAGATTENAQGTLTEPTG